MNQNPVMKTNKKVIGIIPARYGSTRFPGKPLVTIKGKSMIQRVYEQCIKASELSLVVVATDDERILNHVKEFGGNVYLTSTKHQSGTDRCAEIMSHPEIVKQNFEIVINIQGDEPFINPEQINQLVHLFNNPSCQIGTLIKKINSSDDIQNPTIIKVVCSKQNKALYFSRSPIPYKRNNPTSSFSYYKHIGIYGYQTSVLQKITQLEQSSLEIIEGLEQLRWLENGYTIQVDETMHESYSVDVPEDLNRF
jgi:3-deoxy-manno-octulosonate cytidylyltransferase (CMP-KDO synthetase)